MGNYTLPTNSAQLIGLATKTVAGMQALATPLGLTLITTAQMEANLAAFTAQDTAFNAARSARQTASDGFTAAMAAVYPWELAVRNILVARFGTRWNTRWAQAGFTNGSTAIPAKIQDQLGLALALVHFFTVNPTFEVPTMNLTAAQGTTLRNAALAAQGVVSAATVSLNTIGTIWQTAYDALTRGMRALLANLGAVLANDDPRWLSFGFQMPSTVVTPGKPGAITVSPDATGSLVLQCPPVPLATRYRWRTRLVGLQTDYQLAKSTPQPLAAIPGGPPGQALEILVQAVNGTLQGVPSDPVLFIAPRPMVAATIPVAPVVVATELVPRAAATTRSVHGNHGRNGHHAPAAPAVG